MLRHDARGGVGGLLRMRVGARLGARVGATARARVGARARARAGVKGGVTVCGEERETQGGGLRYIYINPCPLSYV